MTVRIAQFVHAASDVVDEAFLRDFPEVEAAKAHSLESLANALDGAEILHVYNSAFTAEFARLVRDKGRALKWIQFTTVGIEIGLKAGLPEGVWVTNSGDVSQRALASHAMALMLGVMRGFRRFGAAASAPAVATRGNPCSQLIRPRWRAHGDPRHGPYRTGDRAQGQGVRYGGDLRHPLAFPRRARDRSRGAPGKSKRSSPHRRCGHGGAAAGRRHAEDFSAPKESRS